MNIGRCWNLGWEIRNVDNYLKCECFVRKFNVDKSVDKKIGYSAVVFFYLFLVIGGYKYNVKWTEKR